MLQIGKTYTWDEIAQAYPDQWAFISNVRTKDGEIVSCKLLAVCSKAEKSIYLKKYLDMGIKFEYHRTTFKAPNVGVLA